MQNSRLSLLIGVSLALAGCPDEPATQDSPGDPWDASVADARQLDAALDARVMDARAVDAAADASMDASTEMDAAVDAMADAAEMDADVDAMPPPERCMPPCGPAPMCDGHLVCEAGQCVALERMQCEGTCAQGACGAVNCNRPPDQCAGPLKWLADLVRYNGEMASLRSMMVGAVNDTSDRVFCTAEVFMSMRCVQVENPLRRTCEARNVSRAMVEGELSFRDETIDQCNEFSAIRMFELQARGYRNTPFGANDVQLQMDGVAIRSDETYYAPSWRWQLALSVGSVIDRFDRPVWAPLGLTRIDANGRYSRGTAEDEAFPSPGYRETEGTAQFVHPDGRRWNAECDVRWQAPFGGEMPQPGCPHEPWSGEAQVQETLADGSAGSTWILAFDGSGGDALCNGTVPVIKDGLVEPPLSDLAF